MSATPQTHLAFLAAEVLRLSDSPLGRELAAHVQAYLTRPTDLQADLKRVRDKLAKRLYSPENEADINGLLEHLTAALAQLEVSQRVLGETINDLHDATGTPVQPGATPGDSEQQHWKPSYPDEWSRTHYKTEMARVDHNLKLWERDQPSYGWRVRITEDMQSLLVALARADSVIRAQAVDLENLRPEVEGLKGDVRAAEAEVERLRICIADRESQSHSRELLWRNFWHRICTAAGIRATLGFDETAAAIEQELGALRDGDHRDERDQLRAEVERLRSLKESLTIERDTAYAERARLLGLLASLFPARLMPHNDESGDGLDWHPEWMNVLCLDLPTGQATWHLHDSQLEHVGHVQRVMTNTWDGHTTCEKYRRVAEAAAQIVGLPEWHQRLTRDRDAAEQARLATERELQALLAEVEHLQSVALRATSELAAARTEIQCWKDAHNAAREAGQES